jgi:hypothetical protein
MSIRAFHMALAQILIFAIALGGFIGLMYVIVIGQSHLDATTEKLIYTMLGVFGTIVTQMAGYFYSRQRPDAPATQPEPKTP